MNKKRNNDPGNSSVQQLLDLFDIDNTARRVKALILSDLHFKGDDKESNDEKKEREKIVGSLEKYFDGYPHGEICIVFVAGDLANHAQQKGYASFMECIKRLRKTKALCHAVFYMCPGNHDLTRTGIKNHKQALHQLLSQLHINKFHESYTAESLTDIIYSVLRNCGNNKKKIAKLFKALGKYEETVFKDYRAAVGEFNENGFCNGAFRHTILPLSGLKTVYAASLLGIDVLAVNSAWFCGLFNRDKEKLFLINPLVTELTKAIKSADAEVHKSVAIGLMHHPYPWLHESEFSSAEGYNNQSFSQLCAHADIIISGHEHGDFKKPHSFNSTAHLIVNGCTYSTDKIKEKHWPCTFGIITIEKIKREFTLERFIHKIKNNSHTWNSSGNTTTTYHRVDKAWKFSPDAELYYQRIQTVLFFKKHICKLPEYKSLDNEDAKIEQLLLEKQVKDVLPMLLSDKSDYLERIESKGKSFYRFVVSVKSNEKICIILIDITSLGYKGTQSADSLWSYADVSEILHVDAQKNIFFFYKKAAESCIRTECKEEHSAIISAIHMLNNHYALFSSRYKMTAINVFHVKILIG